MNPSFSGSRALTVFRKTAAHAAAGIFLGALMLAAPVSKFAAVAAGENFPNPIKASSIDQLLTNVLSVVIVLGAIVVVLYLILAGFKYVTARGDPKQIAEANATLTWTVIGGLVVLGAQVIAKAIQGTVNELK